MGKPIQFSEAAFIGIHAMAIIAMSKNHFVNVNKISDLTGASKSHVSKIMQILVKSGFLNSVRGPTGGFSLAKDPSEITFLDIYEAIEGKITIKDCPFDKPICPFNVCLINNIFSKITYELLEFLRSTTLASIKQTANLKDENV